MLGFFIFIVACGAALFITTVITMLVVMFIVGSCIEYVDKHKKTKGDKLLITKIPSKEIQWTAYAKPIDESGAYETTHIVTSNPERTLYYLYEVVKGGFEKISKSKNPNDFDEIVFPKRGETKSKKKKQTKS